MVKSIYVIVEAVHETSYWCIQMLDAIYQRAAYRRQQVIRISEEQLDRVPPACSPIIILGATQNWQDQLCNQILARNLRCILLSSFFQKIHESISVITLNQSSMAEYAVHYFHATNHRRIAYVAYNARSVNDNGKLQSMINACQHYGMEFSEKDVFPFDGDVEKCVESFVEQCEPYDAVLCANDVSGIMLAKHPRLAEKKRIPEDMYVISYGNTLLSKLVRPTLTSVTLDYKQVGTNAVDNVIYLRKNPGISAQYTVVKAHLIVGASTNYESVESAPSYVDYSNARQPSYTGFYSDRSTQEILQVESLLNTLDKMGLYILLTLLRGYKKGEILDALYIAESTYKYRLRKICDVAGVKKKEDLVSLLERWIDPDILDDYLAQHSMIADNYTVT